MQEQDGTMRMLADNEFAKAIRGNSTAGKVISIGECFQIKHTYYQITGITPEGITAKGISRREYFDKR